jgi:hypothetical protein
MLKMLDVGLRPQHLMAFLMLNSFKFQFFADPIGHLILVLKG